MMTRHRSSPHPAIAAAFALAVAQTAIAEDSPLGAFGGDVLRQELAKAEQRARQAQAEAAEWKGKAEAAERARVQAEVAEWKSKAEAAERARVQAEQSAPAAQDCRAKAASQAAQIADLARKPTQCPSAPPQAPTAALPRDLPKACAECPEMVELPPGEFLMGSSGIEKERDADEGPQHKVKIGYRLAMGKYEVTFAEWDACEAANKCPHADHSWSRDRHPVVNVSWGDAQTYIHWLNDKTGQNYRLPSEAEWEYAARAGTTTPFSIGLCITTAQANYDGRSDYSGCVATTGWLKQTQLVGHYPPNPWHLFDMHGNVQEWTQDCYHENYNNAPGNGFAWGGGENCAGGWRVLRGGSWFNDPRDLRSANRYWFVTDSRLNFVGFRLARTLKP
jgi:formylglycine-generating enzyme required for sulfatase activity